MYPNVYNTKHLPHSAVATTYEQIGYSIPDVVSKVVLGLLIWAIVKKSPQRRMERSLIPK